MQAALTALRLGPLAMRQTSLSKVSAFARPTMIANHRAEHRDMSSKV